MLQPPFSSTTPTHSPPYLMKELRTFKSLLNFKVNLQKSEALNIFLSASALSFIHLRFPFLGHTSYSEFKNKNLIESQPNKTELFAFAGHSEWWPEKMENTGPLLVWQL